LDVLKVDLGEAYAAVSVPTWVFVPPWVTARRLVLLLLRACGHVKWSWLGVIPTHVWACAASGAGMCGSAWPLEQDLYAASKLGVSDVGAGAPSDANALDGSGLIY
jgi:hypothetical protein